ncbi:MAG: hypothetical protein QNJ22_07045 [Desulfosarcinaceae bacterium]|nr:hypothetical protein [Desulfosarcinaceae bacterium]
MIYRPRCIRGAFVSLLLLTVVFGPIACGGSSGSGADTPGDGTSGNDHDPIAFSDDWPTAGSDEAPCAVPDAAREVDTGQPDSVVGDGTPQSCTSEAFVDAVAQGGVITFNCGPDPVTITLTETAKIFNDTGPEIVIDGGARVTLDGDGRHRILYMNTCDPDQVWTTPHCQDQDHPRLTVQNLTFVNGNATGAAPEGSGGAIFVRGGRFKIVNCRFFNNRCDTEGPDVGGAAVRVLSQHDDQPVYVVASTFGGRSDLANVAANGGALSSIGVSFTILNTHMSHNQAVGYGANPQRAGTPGGGSGGAIYNDGNTFTLSVCGSTLTDNTANEGGGAIFFVSNDRSGVLHIEASVLRRNPELGFRTLPGIFVLAGETEYIDSVIAE